MSNKYISTVIVLIAGGLCLSGCAVSNPSPDEAAQKFARALSGLESFHYQAILDLSGDLPTNLGEDVTEASITFSGDIDSHNFSMAQFTLDARVEAVSQDGPMSVAGQMIGLQDETYFKLTDLVSPAITPTPFSASSQWYKIKHPSTSGEADKLGVNQITELTPDQVLDIRASISQYPLFKVTEAYPDETAGGQRSYHYQAKLDEANLQQLITKLDRVTELEDITTSLSKLDESVFDIWVSKRSFQLTRLTTSGIYPTNGTPMGFKLDITFTRHNDKLSIKAPAVSEELGDNYPFFLPSLGL